ncbi:enoyl-ACP reductase FabI [Fundidesulfovibrio agrisoli]|uniref:enoyl-ACP reductase FabI n=1 Tax=Fundidesulfovibrio agrisoli TaxID=2922717 RepID=UPI001FAC8C05|nr:enoyl-ACP reductase [Fundidesulfovibrio agrisoli]
MLLQGKKALIFGVANDRSIAYGVAKAFKDQGARLAFGYPGDAIRKRVEPISEELGGEFTFQCDVTSDEDIAASAKTVSEKWGGVDILVHSVAYARQDDLKGRFMDVTREGFALALDVSAYSLVALCKGFDGLLADGASVMTMSYLGAEKVVPSYNVMGVAKAALECSVRYLAADLGPRGIRVNSLSAGPLKTLAASGITGFKGFLPIVEERAPLKRNITQEDVAGTAVYLASGLSSGVTGEVIHVDSGFSIMGI